MIIELTNEEASNLMVFLNRVQLTGQEAVTFVVLQQKLALAQQQAQSVNGTMAETVGEPAA